jgi:hypothetical protein
MHGATIKITKNMFKINPAVDLKRLKHVVQ